MINIAIGLRSDGEIENKDLLLLPNLFFSYQTEEDIRGFVQALIMNNAQDIARCLIVTKQPLSITNIQIMTIETFVQDEPELGSIKDRNKIFSSSYNAFKKVKKQNRNSGSINLIVIEDLWQLVPRLKGKSVDHFKELLNYGSDYGFHFIVGSSMPYRNLLLQLMIERKGGARNNSSAINQLGAEIIVNPDGMIFFREKNSINFESYYPLK